MLKNNEGERNKRGSGVLYEERICKTSDRERRICRK